MDFQYKCAQELHQNTTVILEVISELPRRGPGCRESVQANASQLTKSLPAPEGKDSRDLESPNPGPGPDPRGLDRVSEEIWTGRCRAGAGARQVQGRCKVEGERKKREGEGDGYGPSGPRALTHCPCWGTVADIIKDTTTFNSRGVGIVRRSRASNEEDPSPN